MYRFTTVLLAGLASFLPLRAAVLHVNYNVTGAVQDGVAWETALGGYDAIQRAIDMASTGDEIWVARCPYTYLTLKDGVAVYGGFSGTETQRDQRNWAEFTTTVFLATGSVVTVPPGAGPGTVLDGFHVQGGNGGLFPDGNRYGSGIVCQTGSSPLLAHNYIYMGTPYSGAIYCYAASPTIRENTISGNKASGPGGGIAWNAGSSPVILGNVISGNTGYAYGGGLYGSGAGQPNIRGNTIVGNTANSGGGLAVRSGCAAVVEGNTFRANLAASGGGVYSDAAAVTIRDNAFLANTAVLGGGVYAFSVPPTAEVNNNSFVGNSGTNGAAIACGGSLTAANNLMAFNASGFYRAAQVTGTLTLRNNDVFGNGAYDYSGTPDPTGSNGNIRQDPHIASQRFGVVQLLPDSPCRGAGDPSVAGPGETDVDGQPRLTGGTVDIGADQSDGSTPVVTPRVLYVKPTGDDSNDGASWATAKRTIGSTLTAAASTGGEVWASAGAYWPNLSSSSMTLPPYVYIYGGFRGTETDRSQRDWRANVSQLGTGLPGSPSNSLMMVKAGHLCSGVDGFTLTGGRATSNPTLSGGAVNIDSASPILAHDMFISNTASSSGGAVYARLSRAVITDSIFANNTASGGSAVYGDSSVLTLAGNSFVDNHSDRGGPTVMINGGGLVVNNIVAFNNAGIMAPAGGIAPTFSHNDVFGNAAYDYADLAVPSADSISADPLFRNRANFDFRLLDSSPGIDAGDDAAMLEDTDVDGARRVRGSHIDIGASEFFPVTPYIWADVLRAVSIAAGLAPLQAGEVERLNVEGIPAGAVDIADAVSLAQRVSAVRRNP